jgi:hypothetical protein
MTTSCTMPTPGYYGSETVHFCDIERAQLRRMRNVQTPQAEARFISRFFPHCRIVKPETIGALTSGLLFFDPICRQIFWDSNYETRSFIEDLRDTGETTFTVISTGEGCKL